MPSQDEQWLGAVEHASSIRELVAIVRGYVDSWEDADLRSIPIEVRPIETGEQIAQAAYPLTAARLAAVYAGEEVNISLERMATFMATATRRVAALSSPTPPPMYPIEPDIDANVH